MQPIRRLGTILIVGAIGLAPAAAHGAWTTTGYSSGTGSTARVNATAAPRATADGPKVVLEWDPVTLSGTDGVAPDGYRVRRHLGDGGWDVVCTASHPATTCDDPEPVAVSVEYGVIAYKGNWNGPESPLTAFTFDSTAPDAPSAPDLVAADDTGVSSTDNITSKTTVTVSGTAEAGSTVRVYRGSTELGSAVATGAGAYSVSIGLVEGDNALYATATDPAGNVSAASTPLTVIRVDSTIAAPSAPDLVAADDTGVSSTDNITSKTTVTVSGTAEAGSTVRVYRGSTELGSAVATGAGAYSVSIGLVEGDNALYATATDPAGNVSAASTPLTVIVRDTVSPTAPGAPDLATADDSGSSNTDNITNKATVTLVGTAATGETVRIYRDATELGSGVATGGNYSISVVLAEGSNPLYAAATDAAGNLSSSATLAITLDTLAPNVTMQYPTSGSGINNGQWNQNNCASAAPTGIGAAGLCGYVDGTGSGVTTVEYELRATTPNPDTCFNGTNYASGSCGSWRTVTQTLTGSSANERRWGISVSLGTVPNGSNELRIRAVDAAGNSTYGASTVGTATFTFTK